MKLSNFGIHSYVNVFQIFHNKFNFFHHFFEKNIITFIDISTIFKLNPLKITQHIFIQALNSN